MNKLSYFSKPNEKNLSASNELNYIWQQVTKLRYDVFAEELQQYSTNVEKKLDEPGQHFVTLSIGDDLIGYVSINSSSDGKYRLEKYFGSDILADITKKISEKAVIYEVRGLTINRAFRSQGYARLLMMAALKFSHENGAENIIAMGHKEVLPMYRAIGMHVFEEHHVSAGDVVFFPMIVAVDQLMKLAGDDITDLQIQHLVENDDACYHGGASWDESGFDFTRRKELVVADVLDSPFPPCPEVMESITENIISSCHESPPTQCEPLIEKISQVRGIPESDILVSSGSSSLMFSLMPNLLNKESRVLILSPMYGEYLHILTHLIGCHVTHFPLHPEEGFVIDSVSFVELARDHDAVIIVNPNSPTGVYDSNISEMITHILSQEENKSKCKMIWVDETYIEYVKDAVSLESLTSQHEELIVCKSMSKCYALSGLRVAYAVTANGPFLRRFIPPWSVSLPAQIGAIAALSNEKYYDKQYSIVHQNRAELNQQLVQLGFQTYPSVANYILTKLPDSVAHSSNQFIALCRQKDVFVRDAENMGVTLDSRYVRFAVRSKTENQRIIDCLTDLLGNH
jgi:histidinol-phosphate/aromatic aminotransferase/cobyric acid decarboxylase-like protein/predicted GNAT family N-acyltransferase